jgi:hypothetical protein
LRCSSNPDIVHAIGVWAEEHGMGPSLIAAAMVVGLLFMPARAAEQSDLSSAAAVAFGGHDDWTVERPGSGPVHVDVSPESLVPLGGQRYALVALEFDPNPSHGDPGAIAVAYVRRIASGWTLERVWKEVTWSGSSGSPADDITTLAFGPAPMIVAAKSDGGQGEFGTTAWIISLSAAGPRLLGDIPLGGHLEPDACASFTHYSYGGAIFPPKHSGAVLSVLYKGWTAPPNRTQPKTPFSVIVDYSEVGGRLVPDRDPHLPDGLSRRKPGT